MPVDKKKKKEQIERSAEPLPTALPDGPCGPCGPISPLSHLGP